jgi:3-dehydroshikimate dehydratase
LPELACEAIFGEVFMLRSGMVSITFRKLSPRRIVDLVAQAGLEGIEWGGDIHVPHGDLAVAREVRRMTEDSGIRVPSYGSYYRVGLGEPAPFEDVLATASELGAPVIRVWAGAKGSAETAPAERGRVEQDSLRVASLAAKAGVAIAYEYHGNTLTDTLESAQSLLKASASAGVKTYWQPRGSATREDNLRELRAVLPHLSHVHCFAWRGSTRLPLAEGSADWKEYLAMASLAGGERAVHIEFVKDDSPEAFLEDARTLKNWLAAI